MTTESSQQAVEQPVWVVPYGHEVSELIRLATMLLMDETCSRGTRLFCGGIASAAGWARGQLLGPVTERDEYPVTARLADVEIAVAGGILHGIDQDEVRRYCALLGERYWPPVPEATEHDYVSGAWWTLKWMLGSDEPPLRLPVRDAEGRLLTADELYTVMLADEPNAGPARRAQLRQDAVETARESYSCAKTLNKFLATQPGS